LINEIVSNTNKQVELYTSHGYFFIISHYNYVLENSDKNIFKLVKIQETISIHKNIFSFYCKNKKMRSKMETELFRKIFSLGKLI